MNIRQLGRLAVIATLLSAVGCASQHQVTGSVRADDTEAQIEALAVFVDVIDGGDRRQVEYGLSEGLKFRGIPAEVSYIDMPDVSQVDDLEAIKATYQNTGANMALTIEVAKERSEAAQNAEVASQAVWLAAVILDNPELRRAAAASHVTSYSVAGRYQLLVRLWDADSGQQLWQMTTKSFSNDDMRTDIALLAESIADELYAKGFVPNVPAQLAVR